MKWTILSLLAASQLSSSSPDVKRSQAAPEGCKKLPTDSDWPESSIWKAALKGVEARGPQNPLKTRPDYKYEANTVAKVQDAVKFAASNNVRLSIMNSGHDFVGRNDAPSGLSLQIGEMKGVRVLESFTPTPQGAESVTYKTVANVIKAVEGKQAAATIGGGINIDELNKALKPSGLWAVGAAHGEVSVAGGWTQAGGHAALSSYFGMGADQVLELKVVLANGTLVTANPTINQDLFFALRGGGPGTFGVVVEATVKVYPTPKVLSYNFWMNTTDYEDKKSIFAPVAYMCSQLPRLNEEGGIQGYFYIRPNSIQGNFLAPNEYANATQMSKLWDPILTKMVSYPGISAQTLIKAPAIPFSPGGLGPILPSFGGAAANPGAPMDMSHDKGTPMRKRHGPGEMEAQPRGIIDEDSRLLGQSELTHPSLALALEKAMPQIENAQLRSHLVGGGKVIKLGGDKDETSVNPAWRRAYVHMMTTGVGKVSAQSLRDISPDGGAYVNEAWDKHPNYKQTFWGRHYPKLLEIKQKYDPDFVFYVTPGIGSDMMSGVKEADGQIRLCKRAAGATSDGSPPDGDNLNRGDHEKATVIWPLLYQGKGVAPKLNTNMRGVPKVGGSAPVPAASPKPAGGMGNDSMAGASGTGGMGGHSHGGRR